MRTPFTGCGTALVTPFDSSGALDEKAIRRLARRQIDQGIHFLVPCGTTGETPTLSPDERRRVVELVVEEAGGEVPVLAGAGGYHTAEVVEAAKAVSSLPEKRTPSELTENSMRKAGSQFFDIKGTHNSLTNRYLYTIITNSIGTVLAEI